ncbi:class I SAM-dependent methyltransferase [Ilyomonas limi]|uniref:Class I SAM-dependent methyltransferase n=1 Tax=Ilyomonas limi TaxID=2575867 RepID=A0A4U3KXW1_9BACT|nr:class I SAM-dependent methyltransferase [Ilyomonas limi]TKK67222.1 class I SAM-dependent methyltransferase [Ilyomonas limi]
MPQTIHYTSCPACGSEAIKPVLQVKDFTVSKEVFAVWQCSQCTLRFTQDAPAPGEVGKYYLSPHYISHTDTKQGVINQLYHAIRKFTLKKKRQLVQKVSGLQKGSLLDVGAGTGAFAHIMQEAGWNVMGLEPDETARQNAINKYKLNFQLPEVLYSIDSQSFDVITMWHVLEHVHDLRGYLQNCERILKENGTLIIAVPNYTSLDANIYQAFWAAYDVPRHLYHFSPQSMQKLLQQHGFTISQYVPMLFDSFYISMLSEQYKTGKSRLPGAFINGLRSNMNAIGNAAKYSSVIYVVKKSKR